MGEWTFPRRGIDAAAISERLSQARADIVSMDSTHMIGTPGTAVHPVSARAMVDFIVPNPNNSGCFTRLPEQGGCRPGTRKGPFKGTHDMEEEVIYWLGNLLGACNPCSEVEGYLTAGATESNLMGMWIGRNRLLGREASEAGTGGKVAVLTGLSAHFSIPKASNVLGMGEGSYGRCKRDDCPDRQNPLANHVFSPRWFRLVELDDQGRMCLDDLERQIDECVASGMRKFIIVATAGATLTGAFDPVAEIACMIRRGSRRGLEFHLHVDAAFGGMVAPFMDEGVIAPFDFRVPEVASIAIDLYKMGMGPYGAGVFLTRKGMFRHVEQIRHGYRYLDETFAGSRPGYIAAAAWAVIAGLGRNGYEQIVAECLSATGELVSLMERFEIFPVVSPVINIVAVDASGRARRAMMELRKRYAIPVQGYYWSRSECPRLVFRFTAMPHVTGDVIRDFVLDLEAEWDSGL